MGSVVSKVSKSGPSTPGGAQKFFAARSHIQRKCDSCGEGAFFGGTSPKHVQRQADDELIARKMAGENLEGSAPDTVAPEPSESAHIQPQLEVGAVDDPLETEADSMADKVVRREALDPTSQMSGAALQRAPIVGREGGQAGHDVDQGIARARGGGSAMSPHLRQRMEDSFGVDLSSVRLHTGAASAALNEQIGARAFTHGTDIHFNHGQFNPGTQDGTRLLAHEMTHVIQQNAGLRRKAKGVQRQMDEGLISRTIAPQTSFGPESKFPSGTDIHNGVLPQFELNGPSSVDEAMGRSLFIEPGSPGATAKDGVKLGARGKPDLFVAERKIGINQKAGGLGFSNINTKDDAAPRAPVSTRPTSTVKKLDEAPTSIGIGDLKPGHSGEVTLGVDQVKSYITGIRSAATAVNAHQAAHGHAGTWDAAPYAATNIPIPKKLRTPSVARGYYPAKLRMYDWSTGKAIKWTKTPLRGSLVVYNDGGGIYSYEWLPETVPASLSNDQLLLLLKRVEEEVKPKLSSKTKTAPKLKTANRPVRRAVKPKLARSVSRAGARPLARKIQRAPKPHKKFDKAGWDKTYKPWKKDAKKQLDPKKNKETAIFDTLAGAEKRTKVKVKKEGDAAKTAKALKTVRHWYKYGRLYGWFRTKFDGLYVRLARFGTKVKQKLKGLKKSSGSFGSWAKAAAKAMFKVFKIYASWAVEQIADKLLDSFQEGISGIANKLVDAATPDDVKSKIEELHALKDRYQGLLEETQANLEDKLFGGKLKMLEQLSKFEKIAETLTTLIDVVRWGVKLAACASPPLVGCLWNLAIAALEYAFSKIIETCWFGKEIFGWLNKNRAIPAINTLMQFPSVAASTVATKANVMIPIPAGLGQAFAPIRIDGGFTYTCNSGSGGSGGGGGGKPLTPEQRALLDLAKEVGEVKFMALLELMMKRGAGGNVQLDAERIAALGPLLRSTTAKALKDAANFKKSEDTVKIEEFLKSIETYSDSDKKRIKKRDINYKKAAKQNVKMEKKLGWDKKKFIRKDIADQVSVDSKEFADAVYDAQEMMNMPKAHLDGVAGPYTVRAFYWRNKQKKDDAFRKASEMINVAEAKRAVNEADRKAIEEARKKPCPDKKNLAADLKALPWSKNPRPNSVALVEVNGHDLVVIVTDSGARAGGYFKSALVTDHTGAKVNSIVEVCEFYNLDAIPADDTLTFYVEVFDPKSKKMQRRMKFKMFLADPAGTYSSWGPWFNGIRVQKLTTG